MSRDGALRGLGGSRAWLGAAVAAAQLLAPPQGWSLGRHGAPVAHSHPCCWRRLRSVQRGDASPGAWPSKEDADELGWARGRRHELEIEKA